MILKFQIRNSKFFISALLLGILVLSALPVPEAARAQQSAAISFDITPKTVDPGKNTLVFTGGFTGVTPETCKKETGSNFSVLTEFIIQKTEGDDLPFDYKEYNPTGLGQTRIQDEYYHKVFNPTDLVNQSFTLDNFKRDENFSDGTVLHFRSQVYCSYNDIRFGAFGQYIATIYKPILSSQRIDIRSSKATDKNVYYWKDLTSKWSATAKEYDVALGADGVDIKLYDIGIFAADQKTPVVANDIISEKSGGSASDNDRIVDSFAVGLDTYADQNGTPRAAESWGCDGYLANSCSFPSYKFYENPYPKDRSKIDPGNPFVHKLKFSDLASRGITRESTLVDGKTIEIMVVPTIVSKSNVFGKLVGKSGTGVNLPFISSGQKIIIKFSKEVPAGQQVEKGGLLEGTIGKGQDVISPTGPAGTLADIAGGTLISIVNATIAITTAILRWVMWAIGSVIMVPILEATLELSSHDLASGPIAIAWTFVRDVVNMIFILALIVIGLGTMLRLESYNYKKLLVNVIAMALLVNFSLLIARIILQIADAAQFSFVPPPDQTGGESPVRYIFDQLSTTHVPILTGPLGILSGFGSVNSALATTFTLIFQTVLEFGIVATFGALAIFMVIRTVAIWFLLVLSPVAYALQVLPQTASYAGKWWENFIKYAIFAPLMTFFLRLTLILYSDGFGVLDKLSGKAVAVGTAADNLARAQTGQAVSGSLGQYIENYFSGQAVEFKDVLALAGIYVLVLGFLWGSLLVTRTFGIAGAAAVTGIAASSFLAPLVAGKWLGKIGGEYALRKKNEWSKALYDHHEQHRAEHQQRPAWWAKALYAAANPMTTTRAVRTRGKEQYERAKEGSEALAKEVVTEMVTRGKVNIPYRQIHDEATQRKFQEEMRGMPKEQVQYLAKKLAPMKGEEGRLRRRALVAYAASEGYPDDIMGDDYFLHDYEWTDWETKKKHKGFMQPDGTFYGHDNFLRKFLPAYLGMDQESLRLIDRLEQYGMQVGHGEYGGFAQVDTGTGMRKMNSKEASVHKALTEINKKTGRQLAGFHPHNFMELRVSYAPAANAEGQVLNNQDQVATASDWASGNIKMVKIGKGGGMDDYQIGANKAAWRGMSADLIRQHATPRMANMAMGGTGDQAIMYTEGDDRYVVIDQTDYDRLEKLVKMGLGQAVQGWYEKVGGRGKFRARIIEKDAQGNPTGGYQTVRAEDADLTPARRTAGEIAIGIKYTPDAGKAKVDENDEKATAKAVIAS